MGCAHALLERRLQPDWLFALLEQILERLVSELLKAFAAVVGYGLDRFPRIVIELDSLPGMLAPARDEAREAFKPYMGVPFLTLVEAKASGYEDAGNPELRDNNGAPNA